MNPKKIEVINIMVTGLIGFGVLMSSFMACSPSVSSDKSMKKNNTMAVVNGEMISINDFREELKLMKRKYRVEPDNPISIDEIDFLKAKALNQLIRTVLFRQEAEKEDIRVGGEQLKQMFNELKHEYGEESLEKVFQIEAVNPSVWERKLKDSILIQNLTKKIVDDRVKVEEKALKDYFEKHPDEFQKPDQVSALHIMVATEEEARSIHKKLDSKVENFSSLAIKYSLSPEGASGGGLGYFEAGQMPEEFDGVFKLKLRKVSDVIQTPYGYHLFKVIDKKPARKMEYKESRNRIREKLLQEKREEVFREWLTDVRRRAQIKIHDDIIRQVNG